MKNEVIIRGNIWRSLSVFAFVTILIWTGCSKEEFGILDTPLDELEVSFYKIAKGTIDLPADELDDYIIRRDSNSIVLVDLDIFSELEVGTHLVTTTNRTWENMVFRKITAFERSNGQIIASTKSGSMMQAFEEYHIDFSKPEVATVRSDGYLLEAFSTSISNLGKTMFDALDKSGTIPFRVNPSVIFGGNINAQLSHPNTVYRYKSNCNGDPKCFDGVKYPNNNIDADNDGVYDVAEDFMAGIVIDALFEGFYEIIIEDFEFKKFDISVSTSKDQNAKFTKEDKPVDIAAEILTINSGFLADEGEDLSYKYIPLPTPAGVVGMALAIGPVIRAEFDAKMFLGLTANLPAKFDVTLGYIDYLNRSLPVPVIPSSLITVDDVPVSVTEIFTGGSIDVYGGLSGTVKKNIGLAVGGAITFGAPNTLGGAVGGMTETTFYSKVEGEFGVKIIDLFNSQSSRKMDYFGKICIDAGIAVDAFLFTDANFEYFDGINTFFDNKVKIPKNLLPSPFSFVDLLVRQDPNFANSNNLAYSSSKGLCVGILATCLGIDVLKSEVILYEDFSASFLWEFRSSQYEKYTLKVRNGANEVILGTEYNFNESHSKLLTLPPEIFAGLTTNTLVLEVSVNASCSAEYPIKLFLDCDSPFAFDSSLSADVAPIRQVGNKFVQYMSFEQATNFCKEGKKIMHQDEIFSFIGKGKCMNPTGFYINNSYKNSDQFYAWMKLYEPGYGLLEAEIDFNGEEMSLESHRPHSASVSTYAPCICTEQ